MTQRPLHVVSSAAIPTDTQAQDSWTRQLQRSVTTAAQLNQALQLSDSEYQGALRAEQCGLPMRITPHYLSLCDPQDANCPIRRQCVPWISETDEVEGDLVDPLGEVEHEVAPHLVQRYPDRALLLVTDHCGVYCRFCTRSRIVGGGSGAVSDDRLVPAFEYLACHPEIRDVIVSGGDPLTMSTARICRVLAELRDIQSLDTIRLATRVPVTLPGRVTAELVSALRAFHPIWVMTHFNHPKELAPDAVDACNRLADGGFPVMNQTVLMRGINDDASTLEALFRGLVRCRVRPYYLLQMDPVKGSAHFRTPMRRGIELLEALQGRVTSIALPKFVVDTPGGLGKVPLSPSYIVSEQQNRTTLRTFRGQMVDYVDVPCPPEPPAAGFTTGDPE